MTNFVYSFLVVFVLSIKYVVAEFLVKARVLCIYS